MAKSCSISKQPAPRDRLSERLSLFSGPCPQPGAHPLGRERNRLLLARLFSRPSNVLVLDEPTNDLDMETLELLEERLLEYSGTILLVSHDREFLNGVVTSTLVFEENGVVAEYAGGYDDWLIQRLRSSEKSLSGREATNGKAAARKPRERSKSLGSLPSRRQVSSRPCPGTSKSLHASRSLFMSGWRTRVLQGRRRKDQPR